MCDQPDTTSIISSDARTYSTSDEPMSTVLSDFKTTTNVQDYKTSDEAMSTVSDDVSVTPDSSTSLTKCSCPCLHTTNPWEYLSALNLTKEQLLVHLSGHLTKLKNEISVNSKNTSSYKATKLSAGDTRGSSKMMGFIGIVVICLMLFVLISADIMKLLIYCLSCKKEKES